MKQHNFASIARAGIFFLFLGMILIPVLAVDPAAVTVYSHRAYESDQKLFDLFAEKTGIKVNLLKGDADQLIQRLKAEGNRSPADLLITADVGRLWLAKENGLLQKQTSPTLSSIPAHLRDQEGYWFGLTKRARIIVWDKSKTSTAPLSTYQELADPRFEKKILIRSSGNVYNISLVSGLISRWGEEKTAQWVQGLVRNLGRQPQGGDRDQMKALVAGQGDLAVTNTYYIGQLVSSSDKTEQEIGKRMGIVFPDQGGAGTHINVSGAGVCAYSPNPGAAVKLLDFLLSREAQEIFAAENFEYPVIPGVKLSPLVASWGSFKEDKLSLDNLGKNSPRALLIVDKNGWK